MEKRKVNISFNKTRNWYSPKLNLPITWLNKMEVTPESREIEIVFNEEEKTILIKKI